MAASYNEVTNTMRKTHDRLTNNIIKWLADCQEKITDLKKAQAEDHLIIALCPDNVDLQQRIDLRANEITLLQESMAKNRSQLNMMYAHYAAYTNAIKDLYRLPKKKETESDFPFDD